MQIREFVPYLSVTDAQKAVAFYSSVFESEPALLLNMPDGRVMHCEFRFGNIRFFLSEELPEHGGGPSPASLSATTVAIHIYVDDCDAMVEQMKSNGAEVLMDQQTCSGVSDLPACETRSATNGESQLGCRT